MPSHPHRRSVWLQVTVNTALISLELAALTDVGSHLVVRVLHTVARTALSHPDRRGVISLSRLCMQVEGIASCSVWSLGDLSCAVWVGLTSLELAALTTVGGDLRGRVQPPDPCSRIRTEGASASPDYACRCTTMLRSLPSTWRRSPRSGAN